MTLPAPARDGASAPAGPPGPNPLAAGAPDPDLLAALAAGDEAGITAGVGHHFPRLVRYLARLGGDVGLAEDLAQESLVRAIEACRRDAPALALEPWLYTVATRLFYDTARSARARRTVLEASPRGPGGRDPGAGLDDALVLRAAVLRLPPALRTVVVLHFHQDQTLAGIAAITGSPLGTIKWRLHRALRRLRALIDAEGPRGGQADGGQG